MVYNSIESGLKKLDIISLVLSIFLVFSLLVDTFFVLPSETSRVLHFFDNLLCIYFLFEFFYNLYLAKSKLNFLKWGWVDLLSSIPFLDIFRYGRVVRVLKILRLLRGFRSTKHIIRFVFRNKKSGTFASVSLIALMLILFSSIAILQVENDNMSNIKTAEDAIWWAYVTITTVGYGDKFPVTTEGRVIGVVLMTAGVGLFGTFAGYVSTFFIENNNPKI